MVEFTGKWYRFQSSSTWTDPRRTLRLERSTLQPALLHRRCLSQRDGNHQPAPRTFTTVLKTTKDPEDQPDGLGLADIDHFAMRVSSSGLQGICEPHLNRQKSAAEVSSRHSIATGNKSDAGQLSTLSVTKPETHGRQDARSYRSEIARPQQRRHRSSWISEVHGMGRYRPGLDDKRWHSGVASIREDR